MSFIIAATAFHCTETEICHDGIAGAIIFVSKYIKLSKSAKNTIDDFVEAGADD